MPEFVSCVRTEFTDRDRALAQVVGWAEKGTRWPIVVLGPEGCGKTAFLRQVAEALRSLGTTSSTCICWIGFSRLRWTIRR